MLLQLFPWVINGEGGVHAPGFKSVDPVLFPWVINGEGGVHAPGFKSVDPVVNKMSHLTLTTSHSAMLLQLFPWVINGGGCLHAPGFKSVDPVLFPRAIYRKGGLHASGFKSVDDTKDPIKLHQVRSESRTSCQVYEVPASVDSLNSGDAFIAEDCSGKALFIWYGSATNIREKMKAVEAANALKAAHGGAVAVVDEGELDSTDALAFFNLLGVSNPASISIGSADAVSAPSSTSSVFDPARLFKVSSGAHSELPSPLSRDQLTTEAQFGLVAAGCVWVWTGAGAPAGAKAAAFGTGAKLAQSLGMSSNTVVKCIKERFEPGLFTTYFPDWSRGMYLAMLEARANGQTGASPATSASVADLDTVVSGMLEGAEEDAMAVQAATQKRMKAYGVEGSLKVWLVRDSRLLEVPEDEGGEFYGADSYVVLYSYQTGSGQQSNVVYFWLGRHSSNIEGGSAALLATNMAKEEFGSKTPIVLVVQNQEPQHFVRIFKNGLVVHKGDRPDMSRGDAAHADGTRLYQIKGEGVQAAHAVEVEAVTKSLNSSDCYVLSAPGASSVLLWQGKYSSRVEREVAASVAARLARPSGGVDLVKEGEEPPSFWDSLGGQADYPRFDASRVSHLPILYHIHDLSGEGGPRTKVAMFGDQVKGGPRIKVAMFGDQVKGGPRTKVAMFGDQVKGGPRTKVAMFGDQVKGGPRTKVAMLGDQVKGGPRTKVAMFGDQVKGGPRTKVAMFGDQVKGGPRTKVAMFGGQVKGGPRTKVAMFGDQVKGGPRTKVAMFGDQVKGGASY
eukprot:gene13324-19163_t